MQIQNRRRNNKANMTVCEQICQVKEEMCDKYCKFPSIAPKQEHLDNISRTCPLNKLG